MRWWPLVLALLAGRATAGPCGNDIAFPQTSTTDVPLKTFVWIRAGVAGPYELRGNDGSSRELDAGPFQTSPLMVLAPGLLEPDTVYTLMAHGVGLSTFTTAHHAEPDAALLAPPAPPTVGHLHITDGIVDMPVWSPGAVMLHVSVHRDQPNGEQLGEVWISRSGLSDVDLAACTGVTAKLGDTLCFWVSSIAATGQEGGVTGRCAVDKHPPPSTKKLGYDVMPRPSPPRWLDAGVLFVLAGVLALLFVAWRGGREKLYAKVCEPQPIDRVTVAWIARRQLVRRLIALAAVAAAAYVVLPLAALGVFLAADLWRLVRVARAVAIGWPVIADPTRRRAYVTDGLYFQGWIAVRTDDLVRAAAAHLPSARITRL